MINSLGPMTNQLARELQEHRVFMLLLEMVPGLEEHLLEESDEGIIHVAELVRCARPFILLQRSSS